MKKILVLIFISFILSGCSTNNSNQTVINNKTVTPTPNKVSIAGQTKETQITNTGLSLQIPSVWNPNKYRVYKENNSIMVDYTGDKKLSFFEVTVCGKKDSDIPDVGIKMEVKAIDDWVFIISYEYELAYAQREDTRKNNPSEYYDMANNIQEIISSLKIIDKSKLEQWFSESSTNKSVSNQPTNVPTNKTQPEYKKYKDFLGLDENVTKFIKDDIDLDGKQEIVIVFEDDFGLKTFVIREDINKLQKVGKLGEGGYGTSSVEVVKLKEKNQKYILTSLTNGVGLSGFALYEIGQNDLNQITYSASATGVGDDHLVDINEDGYYDGYVQNRYSYDVLYFNVSRFYKWNGQDFKLVSTDIQFDNYPNNPEDVVSQFLKLNILNIYEKNCTKLSKRLSELNISNKKIRFAKEDDWREALQMENVNFNLKENEDLANVTVTLQTESMTFKLTETNSKWQITDIGGENVISNAN